MQKFIKFFKENWKIILSAVVSAMVALWWCFLSPWATYNPTEEELLEMAREYDLENGTSYSLNYLEDYYYGD